MKAFINLLLMSITLASCAGPKMIAGTTTTITKDSILVKDSIIYRDTTIMLPGDTVKIEVATKCPEENFTRTEKKGNTKLTLSMQNGKLSAACEADSLKLLVDSLQTILQSRKQYTTTTTTITVPVEVIKIKKVLSKWFWYLLVFNVIYFGLKYRFQIMSLVKKLG